MLDSITKGRSRKSSATTDKHSGRSDRPKHKSSGSSRRDVVPASSDGRAQLSFLFVVNELHHDSEVSRAMDEWYNALPPTSPAAYTHESPSRVMRYQNGHVSEAVEYHWVRSPPVVGYANEMGSLWPVNPADDWMTPICYKTSAIFSCNPLLPILVMSDDPTVQGDRLCEPLLFFHPPAGHPLHGLSQAATTESPLPDGQGPTKYVAGKNPSWLPSLVPPTYANPYHGAPPSRGLGGELPIVIGLMAFSEAGQGANNVATMDEIFLGRGGHRGRWRDGRWNHRDAPKGYPRSTIEEPRGFLVSIFTDPQNHEGSTPEAIQQFEWHGPIVVESSRDPPSRRS